jgi:hypothetical protein
MKLVDANVLLYAYNSSAPGHEEAKGWLEAALSSEEAVAFSWDSLLAFLRIATNAKLHASPMVMEEAIEIVDEWLARPNAVLIQPTGMHWPTLTKLLRETGVTGPLVTDAHVAALALEHDATVYSRDSDFRRFRGLQWVNPLEPHS